MNWKVSKKSILWAIGAIASAIASNALWDFLFKPLLLFTQNGVLTLTTFGIQRFKDAIYIEIAKGHYDRASEALFLIFTGFLFALAVSAIAILFLLISRLKQRSQSISSRLNAIETGTVIVKPSTIESLRVRLADAEQFGRSSSRLFFANTALITFTIVIGLIITVRVTYIGHAVAYYEQLIAIATPYLTDDKEKRTASEFAQIKTRNDYERIILELRSVVEMNGQSVPQFDIW
jgi:hypothetical protein